MAFLPPMLEAWRHRGACADIFGHQVFYLDVGPRGGMPLLLLHGFPTSSFDFHAVLDGLAADRRVIVHDHIGFGLSQKPKEYSYSLFEQADIALGLWRSLGITGGHLLAHDYGTSIATELAARQVRGLLPITIDSMTLSNGSVRLELAHLRPAQRLLRRPWLGPCFARLLTAGRVRRALCRLWADPSRVDRQELDALWWGIRYREGHLRAPQVIRYLEERVRFHHRWLDALGQLEIPVHILWGRRDPVAVPAIAERLRADARVASLTWIEDAGHYPMLETPVAWRRAALGQITAFEAGAGVGS